MENPTPSKKAHIRSYGCQMNAYDGARMEELLGAQGYVPTADVGEADLIVMNTCHIREKAVDKVYSELGKFRVVKEARARAGRETLIAVAGCVAQAEGSEIVRREKAVDIVVGPQAYHRLPQLLDAQAATGATVVESEFPAEDKFGELSRLSGKRAPQGVAAFLTVQEGCDKFCSFCVVPYTRGAEFSRPAAQVVAEARQLVAAGAREITLLGQNVNAYRGSEANGESATLARLIADLSSLEGLSRIRYTTSHPRDMTDDLIAAHAENPKLMPCLHLPVQAGSDRVLKRMNRQHTADDYVRVIERVRRARPDLALSGDFIVGYPGETEADFQATLDLVDLVGFAQSYSFKYSPRPGTPAAEDQDQIAEDVKADRLQRLQVLLTQQMLAFNAACVGRELPVLIEKPGRYAGQVVGRSPYLQPVHFDGGLSRIGDLVNVGIRALSSNSLAGQLVRVAA